MFRKVCQTSILLALVCGQTTFSLVPWFHDFGYLLLCPESGDYPMINTRFKATVCGVETWYRKYKAEIEQFVSSGPFYAEIPTMGPYGGYWYEDVLVDEKRLADIIWIYTPLNLGDVPETEVRPHIEQALLDDRNGDLDDAYLTQNGCFDPYYDWKWRSAYMEDRYAVNGDPSRVMANCWGTADYLARDEEWADGYSYYKDKAIDNGISAVGATFPYIYVDGTQYGKEYCIDDDLDPGENQRAVLKGHGYADRTPKPTPADKLNSFDVIRLASNPSDPQRPDELVINNQNVGYNLHCTAFLCTDEQNQVWVYEKHNFGNTLGRPYGINILGNCQHMSDPDVDHYGDCYNSSYNSYFKKYGNNKDNLTDSYEMDWANVE